MTIKYLCYNCAKLLNLSGFDAVNEVGRKHCEGCGDNQDNLTVIGAEECNRAIEQWNDTHREDNQDEQR